MFGSGKQPVETAPQTVESPRPIESIDFGRYDPQHTHQLYVLKDFQEAVRTNEQAERALIDAQRIAAQAALALVEARKRMRRVTDGVV